MAPPMEDDFDFADLADLDLDDDERAMLAQDYRSQRIQHTVVAQPVSRNQASGGFHPFNNRSNNTTSNNTNNNRSTFFQPNRNNTAANNGYNSNSKAPVRDEFEDFGDLDDAALLDDKDLMEDTMSTLSAPPRSTFLSNSNTPQTRTPQQQQGQPFRQQSLTTPAGQAQASSSTVLPGPTQPTKFFSIFGGAKNQQPDNSNTTLNAGNHVQGGLSRAGPVTLGGNGSSNASPYFNGNNNNSNNRNVSNELLHARNLI